MRGASDGQHRQTRHDEAVASSGHVRHQGAIIASFFLSRQKFDPWGNLRYHDVAGWSSLVARWAHNPKVVGSNPTTATNQINYFCDIFSVCSKHCLLALGADPHPGLHSVASEVQVIRAIAT